MDISVIIVSYNAKYFLEHCLLSVLKAARGLEIEIIVADNHSSDGSCDYHEKKFPGVRFIRLPANVGFSKANNIALTSATGRLILFLNPDTIIPEDCLIRCRDFISSNADCGMLGVKMIDGSGAFLPESKRNIPRPGAAVFKMLGIGRSFTALNKPGGYYADHLGESEIGKANIIAGAFMMVKKEILGSTGAFDESFFMYGEDIDLSYRVLQSGLQNYYLGDLSIIHFKGESTRKKDRHYRRHFYGAMKIFADKHYGRNLFRDGFISGGRSLAAFRSLFTKRKTGAVINGIIRIAGKADEKVLAALRESGFEIRDAETATRAKNILFCEGEISNKEIIAAQESGGGKLRALFRENGADSIICSPRRDLPGFFITMS